VSTSSQTYRDRMMAALGAAEKLVAISPVDPYEVVIGSRGEWGFAPGTPANSETDFVIGVTLQFTQPNQVLAFGSAVNADVEERPRADSGGRPVVDTVAAGGVDGVPFYAWTRTSVPQATAGPAVTALNSNHPTDGGMPVADDYEWRTTASVEKPKDGATT